MVAKPTTRDHDTSAQSSVHNQDMPIVKASLRLSGSVAERDASKGVPGMPLAIGHIVSRQRT